jgi:hypothetical protein
MVPGKHDAAAGWALGIGLGGHRDMFGRWIGWRREGGRMRGWDRGRIAGGMGFRKTSFGDVGL